MIKKLNIRKYIKNNNQTDNKYNTLKVAIITPMILCLMLKSKPSHIVFDNYEIILNGIGHCDLL